LFQIYTFSYRRVSNSGKGDATSTPVLLAEVLSRPNAGTDFGDKLSIS
jgi:hypothetical protein